MTPVQEIYHAMNRFGLGASQTDLQAASHDPRGWLISQLERPSIPASVVSSLHNLDAPKEVIGMVVQKALGKNKNDAKRALGKALGAKDPEKPFQAIRQAYLEETHARFCAQVSTKQPFIERLVMFWSNHFTVSTQKPIVSALVNRFEVEAIRPHVTGNFSDMLIAAEKHAAMQLYLDNSRSIGPNSPAGRRRDKGLNENLAREILELHTLGVNGGYTQNDVISLAKIITGWGTAQNNKFSFSFEDRRHEPGPKNLLGLQFQENGVAEGEAALRVLALHPSTARHIATKLARHFIDDNPPQRAIDQLESTFKQTDGDLYAVSKALVKVRQSWDNALTKIKSPYEFVLSAFRLTGLVPDEWKASVGSLESLNYRVFGATSPAGYTDHSSDWISSDALLKRIDWARLFVRRLSAQDNPLSMAERALGPYLGDKTRFTISGAESAKDGLAFLLISPEFQRR